jgi:hypothetical protein
MHFFIFLYAGFERCVGQLAGLGVVAARADRGVWSEEKLTPLQPIRQSRPLGGRKGGGGHLSCLPLDPPLLPCYKQSANGEYSFKA